MVGLFTGGQMPSVNLKGMSFEKGLRIFRKKCERAGVKDRCREKEYYVKPNVARNDRNNYLKRSKQLNRKKESELALRRKLSMRIRG